MTLVEFAQTDKGKTIIDAARARGETIKIKIEARKPVGACCLVCLEEVDLPQHTGGGNGFWDVYRQFLRDHEHSKGWVRNGNGTIL